MRGRFLIAIAILAGYFFCSYFIVHGANEGQRRMAAVKALAGQQRIHFQEIALYAEAAASRRRGEGRRRAAAQLKSATATFAAAHAALSAGEGPGGAGWLPPGARAIYRELPYALDLRAPEYVAHARSLSARLNGRVAPNDPDLEYVLFAGPQRLLPGLNAAVRAYDAARAASVARFELLQIAVLVAGLCTLGAIWLGIFMPMERDIAAKERALIDSATLDPLTAVLNRSAFAERVEEHLAHAQRRGERCAMLMIDLDRFKSVNDCYGHIAGDRAIAEAAARMRAAVRAGELIARLGGDEFALFATAVDDGAALDAFAARICEVLRFEIRAGEHVRDMSASVGVACCPRDGATIDQLLARSDEALYAAKAAGRGTYRFAQRGRGEPVFS